jgi:hypothetical protein
MNTSLHITETLKLLVKTNDYFMARVEFPTSESDTTCVVWQGPMRQIKGRKVRQPLMKVQERWDSVRRYTWQTLYATTLPNTARLRNTCGNERCVNPDHYTRTDRFCRFGHALVGANLYIQWATDPVTKNRYSHERCRECGRQRNVIYRGSSETYKPRMQSRKK